MNYYIKELAYLNGETLYNVPAELGILIEMGFSKERASEVCQEAKYEALWEHIRAKRHSKLSETDFTQMIDAPITEEKKLEFANYRKELRDLPQTYSTPDEVVWPEKPTL
ncbi:tail fiber assembly protein [Vibrio cyclitrophicus]